MLVRRYLPRLLSVCSVEAYALSCMAIVSRPQTFGGMEGMDLFLWLTCRGGYRTHVESCAQEGSMGEAIARAGGAGYGIPYETHVQGGRGGSGG